MNVKCEICKREIEYSTGNARVASRDIYCCSDPQCQEDFADYIDNLPTERQIRLDPDAETQNPL